MGLSLRNVKASRVYVMILRFFTPKPSDIDNPGTVRNTINRL